MATSSIHIEAGASGYFAHNSRESKTVNSIFNDEQNYCSCTNAKAFETFKSELSKRTNAYIRNNPTRTKLHSKTITHLSAIVNFNKEHTPKDIQKVCNYLEKKFDTKVIQFAMHRDEGHISESDEKIKNYHAHIEFMGLDSKGNSVRRKLDKKTLIELQSEVAKVLKMQRGRNYIAEKAQRPKRLDTYEFKRVKENEAKLILATKEQLKEANNQLRTFMKDNGANRDDYARLEQAKKELEEKLKAKELTEKDLLTKFQTLEKNFISSKALIDELETEKNTLTSKVTTLEEKIVFSPNMSYPQPPKDIQKEFQKIKNEELEEKEVKTGLFSSEKIRVLKPDSNILQRTWNIVSAKYNDLKTRYNDLIDRFSALQKENAVLKEKVRELSTKQQIQTPKKDHLEAIVEQYEVSKEKKSDSSNLKESKEVQEEKKLLKKRGFSNSR